MAPTTVHGWRRSATAARNRAVRKRNGVTQSRVVRVPSTSKAATTGVAGGGSDTAEQGYTLEIVSEGPEIFDDLYLGLQAGGALRKQRRGEELTEEEEAALGRWQQMSVWRKGLAVGAFAVGTFGLGFTVGGLVFGRRRAKA